MATVTQRTRVAARPPEGARPPARGRESRGAITRNAALDYAALIFLGIAVGLVSMLLGAADYGTPMFLSYFSSPVLVALNLLPPVLLMLLIYLVTGRSWIAFLSVSLFVTTLACVHFFRMQILGDALVAADITRAREAGMTFNGTYTLRIEWRICAAAVLIAAGAASLAKFAGRPPGPWFIRLPGAALLVAISAALYAGAYTDTGLYEKTRGEYLPQEDTYTRDFISRGFVYPFIYSVQDAFPKMPDRYTPQMADWLLGAYEYDAIPDEKKVDIISVMLEAYCDLSEFGALDFKTDVYAGFHRLQSESVSGRLIDNIFAGGTIDTERLFLTGYTSMDTYSEPTDSYLYYLKEQGYATEGFHPGDRWFYDREEIHEYLGFDDYYFIDSFEDGDPSDAYFFDKVTRLYESRDRSRPYFSHNLSIQNHGAYYDTETMNGIYIERGELTEPAFNILNNYLAGIYDTTRRLEGFIDGYRDSADPVVILIYGDHKPWLGNSESVYAELGIDLDPTTEEGFYNRYTTPYIIWANDAAKAALGNDFTGDGGDFSPCFLMNKLFDLCSWGGDRYMKAANALRAYTDVVNTPTGYFRPGGGALTDTLSGDAARFYSNFRIIEYRRASAFVTTQSYQTK
ncbi:MAG: LTA synthase family protein [Oscillospiraceae bacterium]|jgi:phosphoglycerol transferase MdoB-like AlkP superfamily enzyme|nr:LTA synthase family protein [Oscillospiraceae bacterium]